MTDPTRRFSSRVENYAKYRPSYPVGVLDLLRSECGLTPASVVTDIGSGTGILSKLFLDNGNPVFAVEPNAEMRAAGERLLAGYPHFTSVAGTGEATPLPDHSAGFVTAGQAFHWLDRARARAEFTRILLPGGWTVLLWNSGRTDTSPFAREVSRVFESCGTEQRGGRCGNLGPADFAAFFGPGGHRRATFDNPQVFDLDSLRGRLMSSSYAPEPGHPNHAPMLATLSGIFEAHQVGGRVVYDTDTDVFYGRLSP